MYIYIYIYIYVSCVNKPASLPGCQDPMLRHREACFQILSTNSSANTHGGANLGFYQTLGIF